MKSRQLLCAALALITVYSAHAYKKVCKKEKFGIRSRMPFKAIKPTYYFIDAASREKLKASKKEVLKDVVVNRCYVRLMPQENAFIVAELEKIGTKKTIDEAFKVAQAQEKVKPKLSAAEKVSGNAKKSVPIQAYYKTLIKVLSDFKNTNIKRIVGVLMRLKIMDTKYQNLKNKTWFNAVVHKNLAILKGKNKA